jgi:hypothetical protein
VGRILRRLIAAVLLTLLLVGFGGSSALAAPCDDYLFGDYPVFDYLFGNYPVILDHPVLNNPVFNTYNNPVYIYKNNTYRYNTRYNNRYNNPY